jgi:predicted lipoprotein
MRKAFILGLIVCLISVPLLFAQAPAPAEKKCSDCHAAAYDGFIKQHTYADAVGSAKCKMCHSKLFTSLQAGKHSKIECEMCHGSGKDHAPKPKEVKNKTCSDCHTHER